jgi:hypothetical protein
MATDINKIKPQILIQDGGVDLTRRDVIDFVGAGVTATDDALNNKTIVTIPGGGAGATGKIGISDNTGSYTFYDTLELAYAGSVSGDTIVFFANVTDTIARNLSIQKDLSINLNGYTYTYSNADTNDTISIGSSNINFKISNGIVKRENGATLNAFQTLPISVKVNNSNCTFENVIFESQDDGSTFYCSGSSNIYGGTFRQNGAPINATYGVNITASAKIYNVNFLSIQRNISNGGADIYNSYCSSINSYSLELLSGRAFNCSFYSATLGASLINGEMNDCSSYASGGVGFFGGLNNVSIFNNCTGYSTSNSAFQGTGILNNCTFYSTASNAITLTLQAKAYNCVGISTALRGINCASSPQIVVNCSAISKFNGANGDAIFCGTNNTIIDNYCEVSLNTNYAVTGTSAYIIGTKGKGMTQLINPVTNNLQVNAADVFGNILEG